MSHVDRISAQPQVNLSLLRGSSLQFQPLTKLTVFIYPTCARLNLTRLAVAVSPADAVSNPAAVSTYKGSICSASCTCTVYPYHLSLVVSRKPVASAEFVYQGCNLLCLSDLLPSIICPSCSSFGNCDWL
jgi:hypothetical protein